MYNSSSRWFKTIKEKEYNLNLEISGLPALINFTIPVNDWLKYKTLITQKMLKKDYLAANSIYVSTEHSQSIVDEYIEALDSVFSLIAECENGKDINELLEGPVCHEGFQRLN